MCPKALTQKRCASTINIFFFRINIYYFLNDAIFIIFFFCFYLLFVPKKLVYEIKKISFCDWKILIFRFAEQYLCIWVFVRDTNIMISILEGFHYLKKLWTAS